MPHAIFSYVHHNRRVAALVTIQCKTDFALRTDLLGKLGGEVAMHIAAVGKFDPEDAWVLDASRKVKDVIDAAKTELGEPVIVSNVVVSGPGNLRH